MLKALIGGLTGQAGDPQPGADADITPVDARAKAQSGTLLLDVREPEEWQSGHAPGAKHVPLGQLAARMGELPRDREIITICRSGNRSRRAADQLRRAGFDKVRNMAGGMIAWTNEGLAVER